MADRIGIELSPFACRIVELPATSGGRPRADAAPPSFTLLPRSGPATAEHLTSLRGRTVSVVLWGLHSDHRQVMVGEGSYGHVRLEARASARAAGVPIHGTLSDVAPAGPLDPETRRRVVLLATAPSGEVTAAMRPLVEAGIKVQTVRTPASALASLARLRGEIGNGGVAAYVAIGETATAVALIEGGLVRFARDFGWGSRDEAFEYRQEAQPEAIGAKLAADLATFVDACGLTVSKLAQIVVTGGVSELRSVAIRLTAQFDVEVEPLDYAGDLNLEGLAPALDRAKVRYADVWLAWAAAADPKPLIDLYRDRRFQVRRQAVARAAVAAGVVLGVGLGWMAQRRLLSSFDLSGSVRQSTPVAAVQPAPASEPPAAEPPVRPSTPIAMSPPLAPPEPDPSSIPVPAPAPDRGMAEPVSPRSPGPEVTQAPRPASALPAPRFVPSLSTPPPVPSSPQPLPIPGREPSPAGAATTRRPSPSAAAPVAVPPPRPSTAQSPPLPPPRAAAVPFAATNAAPESPTAGGSRVVEVALPFEAVLGTILHGADRKLAVVDDRIVQVGDQVRGAVIVDITPNAVMLRDQQGRLRRLTFGSAGR